MSQPHALIVDDDTNFQEGLAQVVELDAAVVLAGPHVEQALAELGMPHQRRHVLEDDRHADVVDRGVGEDADSVVVSRATAEQPDVPGRRGADRLVERDHGP